MAWPEHTTLAIDPRASRFAGQPAAAGAARAPRLATALPQLLLGLGFALPFQLLSLPIRVGLALAGRRALS